MYLCTWNHFYFSKKKLKSKLQAYLYPFNERIITFTNKTKSSDNGVVHSVTAV